jgi:hypothetical protein
MTSKSSYSYSHASTIKWALEMELNRLKCVRVNNEEVMVFLKKRIEELKEHEKECLKIQAS